MKAMKVFFACALGAFVGSIVALQVSHLFWWIGAIAGFVVGYLSYEFKEVIQAMKIAAGKVFGWKPDKAKLKLFLRFWFWFSLVLMTVVVGNLIVLSGAFLLLHETEASDVFFMLALWEFVFCQIVISLIACHRARRRIRMRVNEAALFLELSWKGNPIAVYFYWLPCLIIRLISWITKKALAIAAAIPALTVKVAQFLWETFVLIHSDIRLLCGLDAAIGVVIGYFTVNALIGALAGGLFGVLNYHLISIKLLKLVPAK